MCWKKSRLKNLLMMQHTKKRRATGIEKVKSEVPAHSSKLIVKKFELWL